MKSLKSPFLAAMLGASFLALAGCATLPSEPVAEAEAAEAPTDLVLDLREGQRVQFVMYRQREGDAAADVRKRYFETAGAEAAQLGNRYLGEIGVTRIFTGDNAPDGIAVYAFPTEAAQATFQAGPDYATYQNMRREGWEELHIFSTTMPADRELRFRGDRAYTLAAAWTKPDRLSAYENYLSGIEVDFNRIGATYLAQFDDISLQSHSDAAAAPSKLTFVEWTDGPDIPGLQGTQGYKDSLQDFQNSISRFDLYGLKRSDAR